MMRQFEFETEERPSCFPIVALAGTPQLSISSKNQSEQELSLWLADISGHSQIGD